MSSVSVVEVSQIEDFSKHIPYKDGVFTTSFSKSDGSVHISN